MYLLVGICVVLILVFVIVFMLIGQRDTFGLEHSYPTKCFSCENELPYELRYLAQPTKCFDCEKQFSQLDRIYATHPNKCFACEPWWESDDPILLSPLVNKMDKCRQAHYDATGTLTCLDHFKGYEGYEDCTLECPKGQSMLDGTTQCFKTSKVKPMNSCLARLPQRPEPSGFGPAVDNVQSSLYNAKYSADKRACTRRFWTPKPKGAEAECPIEEGFYAPRACPTFKKGHNDCQAICNHYNMPLLADSRDKCICAAPGCKVPETFQEECNPQCASGSSMLNGTRICYTNKKVVPMNTCMSRLPKRPAPSGFGPAVDNVQQKLFNAKFSADKAACMKRYWKPEPRGTLAQCK
jgi:hypothetical protein